MVLNASTKSVAKVFVRPDVLRAQLLMRGLNGTDLGRLAQLSPPTISRMMTGRLPVSGRSVERVCIALKRVPVLPIAEELINAPDTTAPKLKE